MLPIIEVRNVSKKYRITHGARSHLLSKDLEKIAQKYFSLFLKLGKNSKKKTGHEEDFWSLRDITFSVRKGETVGIIGSNGAGKSTLLRILAGIIEPTYGEIHVRGRCGSLLEIGAGFHPELSGKENIYLAGAVLGIAKKTIEEKLSEIIDFAGVEEFIDTPIKYYSSGMYIRLAFSVATQLEPDILLIDEVLAVGDAEFQRRSLRKMEEIAHRDNRTIIIVSHALEPIRRLCDRVLLLEKGKVIKQGGASDTIHYYLSKLQPEKQETMAPYARGPLHIVTGDLYKESPIEKTETFDTPKANSINKARLDNLTSLQFDLANKRVLDIGSGIGILAQFFIERGSDVVCIDARESNLNELRNRYPQLENASFAYDVEVDDLSPLGSFDIVFCYGLLYHVEKPELVLEKAANIAPLLFLESCIADHPEPLNLWVEETYTHNQAMHGIGSRPTPSFIISALHHYGYPYVYFPVTPPKHEDFQFTYTGSLTHIKDNHPIRQIIIASKDALDNPNIQLVSTGNMGRKNGDRQKEDKLTKEEAINAETLERIYAPMPLVPIPQWHVGRMEYTKNHRVHFRKFWEMWIHAHSKKPLIVFWYFGLKVQIFPRNEISRCMIVEGCYEPNEFFLLSRLLRAGTTFIDLGANIGLYSLFASILVGEKGKVFAFEPSTREFARIKEHVRMNALKNVELSCMAMSNIVGKAQLCVSEIGKEGHNSLDPTRFQQIKALKKESVNTSTLDTFFLTLPLSKKIAIKIDTEGSELNILKGGTKFLRKYKPLLIVEINSGKSKNNYLLSMLKKSGYQIYRFDRKTGLPKKNISPFFLQSENIIAVYRTSYWAKQMEKNFRN